MNGTISTTVAVNGFEGVLYSGDGTKNRVMNSIPSTMTMTALTSEILIRCFLFNGGLGLAFGHLYRKYGIGYAMIFMMGGR